MVEPVKSCTGTLICPVCAGPLSESAGSFRCPQRHTFDRARDGYIHLLPAGHGRSNVRGDTPEMIRARRRFLERGRYEPLSAAINAHAVRHLSAVAATHQTSATTLDAGCGDGYYIGRLSREDALAVSDAEHCYFGLDLSKEAVRLAARTYQDIDFLVNDLTRRICMADGSADLLLNIFAPRNADEFARVLRPGGLLLTAIPEPNHQIEMREALSLLDIEDDKPQRTAARFGTAFDLASQQTLEYETEVEGDELVDLLLMTPNYWHLEDDVLARAASFPALAVTISVRLMHFIRREPSDSTADEARS